MALNLGLHRKLLTDGVRMEAYRQAIAASVGPGDVVLDIGSGSGVLALFACQAGARRVYAVERSDVVFLAALAAQANGCADRIVFLHQDLREARIDEPVDVITSELIGKAVVGQQMAELVGWARERFLRPGGRIVPAQVDLLVAPVENAEAGRAARIAVPAAYGLDFSVLERCARNRHHGARLAAADLLAPAQRASRYDASTDGDDRVRAHLSFVVTRDGTLHGFGGWFESVLAAGVELSNRPPGTDSWDQAFFPMRQPVPVEQGMTVELALAGASTAAGGPWWRADAVVRHDGRTVATSRYAAGPPAGAGGSPAPSLGPERVVVRADGLLSAQVGEEVVVLGPASDTYAGLDRTSRRIWELTATPRSVAEICAVLCREYDAPAEQVTADAVAFLAMLEREGIIEGAAAP